MANKKVKLSYASGWKLKFPKQSNGCMLFLEWLERNQLGKVHTIDFKVKSIPQIDEVLNDDFEIRFMNLDKELVEDCYQYISHNL